MKRILEYFTKKQNKTLIKNLESYAKKEKIEQQKSKILGQKPVKRKTSKI
jgi:hypothetical protein|tara:strand:- start:457 stop:606 length:150 start_codon:yes stop_codon:yes gene_type:complete